MAKLVNKPVKTLILSIVFLMLGILIISNSDGKNVQEDYNINVLDIICVIPLIFKIIYYPIRAAISEVTFFIGLFFLSGGIFNILLCIPSSPQIVKDIKADLSKGEEPTDDELKAMLENGEITQSEYDEIKKYFNSKGNKRK